MTGLLLVVGLLPAGGTAVSAVGVSGVPGQVTAGARSKVTVIGWGKSAIRASANGEATVSFTLKGAASRSVAVQYGTTRKAKSSKRGKWVTWRTIPARVGSVYSVTLPGSSKARSWRLKVVTSKGKSVMPAQRVMRPVKSPTPSPSRSGSVSGLWLSGASGDGVASGAFGVWRGTPVAIAGTWNDSFEAQTAQWSVQKGAEWGSWQGDLDVAVGAIYSARGETWAAAATGAYDARWRTALSALKSGWGSRPGTLHIRFAHEFNGEWVPWKVSGSAADSFVAAWKRFRALQREILPAAKLVFSPNDGSSPSLALDWRKAFPGAGYVDEMAVDSYNQWPYVNTVSGFASKIVTVDSFGAPVGIEKHRLFAESVGLPLAIAEWSSNSSMGDGDVYVKAFRDWVAAHAGSGPGQVPYEIMFNVNNYNSGVFSFYPNTAMPKAAASYVQNF